MSENDEEEEGQGSPSDTERSKEPGPEKEILHPEDWEDPPDHKVISEFHKDDPKEGAGEEEDPDLAEWLEHWKKRSSYKVISEYHKDDAPYLDEPFVDSPVPAVVRPSLPPKPPGTSNKDGSEEVLGSEDRSVVSEELIHDDEPRKEKPKLERIIDVNTIEFLAYTVIRAILPRKYKFSIKKEGLTDMDIIINDKDIIINSNQFMFEFPDMAIWKIILAYKGKPIIEMGRGVKNKIKVYRFRALSTLIKLWFADRKRAKQKKRMRQVTEKEEELQFEEKEEKKRKAKRKKKKKKKKKKKRS